MGFFDSLRNIQDQLSYSPAPEKQNQIKYNWQTFYGNGQDPKGTYQLNVDVNGQNFEFIPDSILAKGMVFDDGSGVQRQYYFPKLLTAETQNQIKDNAIKFDIGTNADARAVLDGMGATTSGILIPAGTVDIGASKMYDITKTRGPIQGMGTTSEGPSYIMPANGAYGRYIAQDGKLTTLTQTSGSSLLGNIFGDWVDDLTGSLGVQDVANSVNDFFQTDAGKALKLAALASNVYNIATAPAAADPNAVGGVTGPDNIDVGGGWSPATGATAAELEAARLALEPAPVTPEYVAPAPAPVEVAPPAPAPTVDAITNDIANSADNIDAGGGFNPATGTGDAATAAAATANPPIIPSVDSVVDEIVKGNADKSALYSNAGYGDTMTSAQIDAYDKAIAAGMTVSDALNYARVGLMVNAFVGDPLGLGGDQPSGAAAPTGFAQVEIPSEWKSPTYAASSAPIDLNSIFSNQNMLGGTQWQNLPNQQNMSFNDIFASGQQQTPMGTPVDINQIVSSILGQAATS